MLGTSGPGSFKDRPAAATTTLTFTWIVAVTGASGVAALTLTWLVPDFSNGTLAAMIVGVGALGAWHCYDLWQCLVHGTPLPAFPWRWLAPADYRESRR